MGNQRLDGKAIMITGATSGLGAAFAKSLGKAGASLAITGRREDRLNLLAEELRSNGVNVLPLAFDVTDLEAGEKAIDTMNSEFGGLWGLVNNSGVAETAYATDTTPAQYDHVMDVNVRAPYFLATAFAKRLIAGKTAGRIVNISSIASFVTLTQGSVYCMSKAAIAHMTKALAAEWARFAINVNAVLPGYIKTEINSAFFDSETGQKMIARMPRKRIGEADDLNDMLVFLMSPESHFMTGSLITMDDGQSLLGI